MTLRELSNRGVPELLEGAALVIQQRGLAKGLRLDPTDGSVDLVAALAVAAGAKPHELINSVSTQDLPMHPVNEAKFHVALDVLDAIKPEVERWADHPSTSAADVQRLLRQAAMRLRIAVV